MSPVCPSFSIAAAIALTVSVGLGAGVCEGQDSGGGTLGLRGVGYVVANLGASRLPRNGKAGEGGLSLDLGHFPAARFRLSGDASFMRTVGYSEYVSDEDREYRKPFYDLSGSLVVSVDGGGREARVIPYLGAGVGVHALTSSIGTVTLDRRYNTNVFGVVATAGSRIRFRGNRVLRIEARAVGAKNVRRVGIHVGMGLLFNDLVSR